MRVFSDENFRLVPLSLAFGYAWAALSGNWKNSAVAAGALLVIVLLSMLPVVGFLASVAQGILLAQLAFWIVGLARQSADLNDFKERVAKEEVRNLLTGHLAPASGYYLASLLITFLFFLVTAAIFWLSGGVTAFQAAMAQMNTAQTPEEITMLYAQIFGAGVPALLFLMLASLFFGYVWPLVYGYALMQQSFGDAFNALFMIFSPKFWKATMRGAYFRLVSLWMLVLLGAGFVMGFAFGLIVLLPLGILILIWMVYFSSIVAAEAYNLVDEI